MSVVLNVCIGLVLLAACAEKPHALPMPATSKTLKLAREIPINVHGRIDHFSLDATRGHLFVAALGNNSVEVIDLSSGNVINSISGLDEPQGVQYAADKLFVANGGTGECLVYDAASFKLLSKIPLGDDADNIRYDSLRHRLFVGYGEGGIGIIDVASLKVISRIALPAHPEAFEESANGNTLYVNVPNAGTVTVLDLGKENVAARWPPDHAHSNFPSAIDTGRNLLFVGCRNPASVVVIDTRNGKTVQQIPIGQDVDDLFLDEANHRLYASCGAGEIDVMEVTTPGGFRIIDGIETSSGSRTSYFDARMKKLFLAVPNRNGHPAAIRIYDVLP